MEFNELANMDSKTRAELQPFSAGCRTKTTILTTRSHVHHRYPHYALTKRTREVTAFVTDRGKWEWLVCPFGLQLGTAELGRFLNAAFEGCLLNEAVRCYCDDVTIFSKDFEAHLEHVEMAFTRLG